jgi:hypothetical protein
VEIIVLHADWRFLTAATLCTFVCLLPHESRAQERAFAPVESPNDIVTGAISRSNAANLGTGLRQSRTDVVEFLAGPFPYDGRTPGGRPFLVNDEDGKRGHYTARGRLLGENTFNYQRTLMHIPQGFNIRKPGVIVVFFHGHGAELNRDILRRQQVPAQITKSYSNAVLLAPQFALDASDSSAGNFWKPGGFARYLREASENLAKLYGDARAKQTFERMPVIIVSYSGGYGPAAAVVKNGGIGKRLRGIVMLDSLYSETGTFRNWIKNDRTAFFVSAYLGSTRYRNQELKDTLKEDGIPVSDSLKDRIKPGTVAFIAGNPEEERHRDFVTKAWTAGPIADVLNRLPEYRR